MCASLLPRFISEARHTHSYEKPVSVLIECLADWSLRTLVNDTVRPAHWEITKLHTIVVPWIESVLENK